MKKVGITGNIASGKTKTEDLLKKYGYKVICADNISHKLFNSDKEVREFLINTFSTTDRCKIGEIIFSHPDLKKELEHIIHPKVRNAIENFFKKNKHEEFVFASIPLLFEANMQDMFDKIILIAANKKLRYERLIKRNNYSKEHAHLRIYSQMPQEDKIPMSDYVIYNESDETALEKSICTLLKNLKEH